MSQKPSHVRFVAAAAVAIFGLAGSVFAEQSPEAERARPPLIVSDDGTIAAPDGRLTRPVVPHGTAVPNDTCASPTPLPLYRTVKTDTTGATDDYQSPATAGCFQGLGQFPTASPGRDVVFSFTAPSAGSYTFSIVHQDPTASPVLDGNSVLYVSDACPASGLVNCLKGSNRSVQRALPPGPTGASNNQSEQVSCIPMSAGQTYYLFLDDGKAASPGGPGASIEVRDCVTESEPNDSPATATPMACGIEGTSGTAPLAHCHLGFRGGSDPLGLLNDGAVCTRSTPLDQSYAESNTRCTISNNPCTWDAASGLDTCPVGEGHCHQLTDLDCDPHCTGGPNDGRVCSTNAFCNPGSAQNATCSGTCQFDSTCIVTATGLNTGTPCTPRCVGGTFDGRYCSSLSDCTGGGGVCTANAGCAVGETCGRQFNEGDEDFFSLGVVGAGNKIFAALDAKAANDYDFRMRITTTTDTLQFDDDDGISRNGSNAPEIAGTPGTGTDTFIKVSRTLARSSEPYLLYSIVRPPLASAQLEDESGPVGNDIYFGWPGDVLSANYATSGGYVRGLFNGTHGGFAFDSDCFKFLVNEGDLMSWYGDGEPARSAAANTQHPLPIIYDAEPAGISNFIFGANARKNVLTANATLNGLTPAVTSTFMQWRASYTGMLEVCYYDAAVPLGLGTPGNGNWAGSLDVNCGPLSPAGPGATTTDVSVEKTILSGDGKTGTLLQYQIAITNSASDIAQEVHLQDVLDPNLSFVSLTVDDGFGANNTTCITSDGFQFLNGLPTPGTADTPIDCINTSMAPGTTTTYVLTVQVNNCIGAGIDISNTATIFTVSTDPDPGNDASTVMFTTTEDGTCQALLCDATSCVVDACQLVGTCNAGVCGTTPVDCNDNSVCTDDSCDPVMGCIHDPTNAGDLCEDFNACTTNACDPIVGCVFPPIPAGVACDDGLTCTSGDQCDAGGACLGINACDDGLPCTDDFADEGNGCACSYAPTFPGAPCNDGNPCTGNAGSPDACDGANACAPGGAADCDDGNACTTDSCNPATGCVHAPITCDDGNVCNGSETCDPATGCAAGTPLACSDGNACNGAETCDPATGCAAGTPLACDDGDVCNGSETCAPASGCVSGTPLACDDGNACNGSETCDPASGCDGGTPLNCNDGNFCNGLETCSPASGCVGGTPLVCNDGNLCNGFETCSPASGCVAGIPLICSDGNACNGAESCSPASGCVGGTPLVCSDGNACNGTETCAPASGCVAGAPPACDDSNVCNGVETCAPATGCVAGTPLSCGDGNACNGVEICNPASGCGPGTPLVCAPSDQCHAAGVCNPGTGLCSNPSLPNGTACNDGNGCTTSDACNGGSCVGGPAPVCNDGNVCTSDACTSLAGCTTRTIDFDVSGFSLDRVDGRDLVVLADAWNTCPGDPLYDPAADLDQGTSSPANCVDLSDFHLFMNSFGLACP